jgi:hypothetical protein
LNIRSAPLGTKVGVLVKSELAPIWAVSDTKWAAINNKQSQWIFIGNPNYVDVAMDTSKIPVPPAGLYKAKVTAAQSLNVRDNPNGKVIRVLTFGTIVQVYEEKNGWARINPTQSEWCSMKYLLKTL